MLSDFFQFLLSGHKRLHSPREQFWCSSVLVCPAMRGSPNHRTFRVKTVASPIKMGRLIILRDGDWSRAPLLDCWGNSEQVSKNLWFLCHSRVEGEGAPPTLL